MLYSKHRFPHPNEIECVQLSEVRREVELSRKRSIKLKAQVDKLQKNRDGPGWSHHRERVNDSHSGDVRCVPLVNAAGSSMYSFL